MFTASVADSSVQRLSVWLVCRASNFHLFVCQIDGSRLCVCTKFNGLVSHTGISI